MRAYLTYVRKKIPLIRWLPICKFIRTFLGSRARARAFNRFRWITTLNRSRATCAIIIHAATMTCACQCHRPRVYNIMRYIMGISREPRRQRVRGARVYKFYIILYYIRRSPGRWGLRDMRAAGEKKKKKKKNV